jgi:CRISPR-associated protein Cas2
MYYCVAYDISNDRTRRRVAIWCKQAGLRRLQASVFAGQAPERMLKELQEKAETVLRASDRFCVIPLDKNALKNIAMLGDAAAKQLLEPHPRVRYF